MKELYNLFLLAAIIALLFGCEKKDKLVVYENGTAPVLTASKTSSMVFEKANADSNALTFSWTNPDYSFNTGISSLNVNYLLEIDTTGSNFTNPSRAQVAISSDLSKTFTVKELNTLLNGMNLNFGTAHQVEFRLTATLMNSSVPLYSNVIKITITPYLDTKYPVPSKLYIIGSATPGGWDNPVPDSQEMTLINAYTYQITIALSAGNSYLFIPVNGSWGAKYGFDGDNNKNSTSGDNFKPEGGDILAPSTSGVYTITVDFKTGKWTVQ